MNKAIITGNLTGDPELKATPEGISVCSFTVAVQRRYKDAGGERRADFIPVTAWRVLAENCARYLAKGRKVCVVGEIQTGSYEAKDGSRRYVTELTASDVEFLPPNPNARNTEQGEIRQAMQEDNFREFTAVTDEDLPF